MTLYSAWVVRGRSLNIREVSPSNQGAGSIIEATPSEIQATAKSLGFYASVPGQARLENGASIVLQALIDKYRVGGGRDADTIASNQISAFNAKEALRSDSATTPIGTRAAGILAQREDGSGFGVSNIIGVANPFTLTATPSPGLPPRLNSVAISFANRPDLFVSSTRATGKSIGSFSFFSGQGVNTGDVIADPRIPNTLTAGGVFTGSATGTLPSISAQTGASVGSGLGSGLGIGALVLITAFALSN